MNYELDHGELVRPSRFYACGGHVSGTCNRHHCHYIAMVPLSRYNEQQIEVPTGAHHPERPRTKPLRKPKQEPMPELPKPKPPPTRHITWVNRTIAMLEAFKRGEQVQMRGNFGWEDFNLGMEIDSDHLIEWRAKPKGVGKNGDTIS